MARSVYLGKVSADPDHVQWAVKIGEVWTECDTVGEGKLTTVNGGTPGGWWGWGAHQDGDLVTGHTARSGATLAPGAASLGHTDITDEEIRRFNKEFIKCNLYYRAGLSEKYCYSLLGWLLTPGYLLENFLQVDDNYSVADSSEEELSSIKEDESETEDPTFEPFPASDQEDSVYADSTPRDSEYSFESSGVSSQDSVEAENHQSEALDDNTHEMLKRKSAFDFEDNQDYDKKQKLVEDESSSLFDDMKHSIASFDIDNNLKWGEENF